MRLPVVRGRIDRRLLINFRIDPAVVAPLLPPPFRPQLIGPFALGGICLIRLKQTRPWFLPAAVGAESENAAHRFAVEWDDPDGHVQSGVYIPRRDSNSWLNTLAGGRIFPGLHHHARFAVDERGEAYRIQIESDDRQTHIAVFARVAESLAAGSAFGTLERASEFFKRGSTGYSPAAADGRFDGLELRTPNWSIRPLAVERVESSFFDNRERFPDGAIEFDSGLLMTGIEHEWHVRESMGAREHRVEFNPFLVGNQSE